MRSVLIDWLVDIHNHFYLSEASLWLCVNIIDRYVACTHDLPRCKFQLVGMTALLIASKIEESDYYDRPKFAVSDCDEFTANAYSTLEFNEMEISILTVLEFRLNVNTCYTYISYYLHLINIQDDSKLHSLASYYGEELLQKYEFLKYSPFKLSAAIVYLANYNYQNHFKHEVENTNEVVINERMIWPEILVRETGLNVTDFINIVNEARAI